MEANAINNSASNEELKAIRQAGEALARNQYREQNSSMLTPELIYDWQWQLHKLYNKHGQQHKVNSKSKSRQLTGQQVRTVHVPNQRYIRAELR